MEAELTARQQDLYVMCYVFTLTCQPENVELTVTNNISSILLQYFYLIVFHPGQSGITALTAHWLTSQSVCAAAGSNTTQRQQPAQSTVSHSANTLRCVHHSYIRSEVTYIDIGNVITLTHWSITNLDDNCLFFIFHKNRREDQLIYILPFHSSAVCTLQSVAFHFEERERAEPSISIIHTTPQTDQISTILKVT